MFARARGHLGLTFPLLWFKSTRHGKPKGFGLSIAVHPKLGQYLIDAYDWRTAWVVLGLMTWIMMLPVLILFVHDKPEPLGLRPDNEPATEEAAPPLMGPELVDYLLYEPGDDGGEGGGTGKINALALPPLHGTFKR